HRWCVADEWRTDDKVTPPFLAVVLREIAPCARRNAGRPRGNAPPSRRSRRSVAFAPPGVFVRGRHPRSKLRLEWRRLVAPGVQVGEITPHGLALSRPKTRVRIPLPRV